MLFLLNEKLKDVSLREVAELTSSTSTSGSNTASAITPDEGDALGDRLLPQFSF